MQGLFIVSFGISPTLGLLWSRALRAKRTAVVKLGIACDQMPSWH
jgi:hypothetical protein